MIHSPGPIRRMPATNPVLVTGAFRLVGTAVVKQLVADGRRVVATDLDVPRTTRRPPNWTTGSTYAGPT